MKGLFASALLVAGALTLDHPAAFAEPVGSQAQYTITDLGTLPNGRFTSAFGINAAGHVVGQGGTRSTGVGHPFLYSQGVLQDIGTLGGDVSGSGNFMNSYAAAINNVGQIVGASPLPDGPLSSSGEPHGFLYADGTLKDLGFEYVPRAINDTGDIVGLGPTYNFGTTLSHLAFVYREGVYTDLGHFGGGSSDAFGINASGQIVGTAYTAEKVFHAFLLDQGTMRDLGTLASGGSSVALAINVTGQITGYSETRPSVDIDYHAFLYANGVMTDLGTLGGHFSQGLALNDHGVVVGYSTLAGGDAHHAFIYQNGIMSDLNTLIPASSGVLLNEAVGINNSGQIVANGCYTGVGGECHAFLLTPVANQLPIAKAGPDRTVAAGASCSAAVALDGSASSDPDGDQLTYTWTGPFGTASGVQPSVVLGLGAYVIQLTVDDGNGGSATDEVVITVADQTPPVVNILTASPNVLRPPNHKMVPIATSISVLDNCGAALASLPSITMNEGSAVDVQVDRAGNISLRAERAGTGGGRVYTITYTFTDTAGNSTNASTTVSVPHDAR